MRFNFDAYEKVFPKEEPKAVIESAVDTFKPTEAENKAMDEKPGDDVMASIPTDEPETKPIESADTDQPEGGTNE